MTDIFPLVFLGAILTIVITVIAVVALRKDLTASQTGGKETSAKPGAEAEAALPLGKDFATSNGDDERTSLGEGSGTARAAIEASRATNFPGDEIPEEHGRGRTTTALRVPQAAAATYLLLAVLGLVAVIVLIPPVFN